MILGPVTQNVPRLYTAIAEWGAVVLFVFVMQLRYSRLRVGMILSGGLLAQIALQLLNGSLPKLFWVSGMIMAVVFMIIMLELCCQINLKTAVYHGMRAFMLAELAASLEWQLYSYMIHNYKMDTPFVRAGFMTLVYGGIFLIAFILEYRMAQNDVAFQVTNKEVLMAILICAGVFAFSNLSFLDVSTPFSSSMDKDIFNIRTLIDVCGYLVLYMFHMQRYELFLQYERNTMEAMLHSQLMQYKLSRESIELVNRKYHDMKHQIAVLREQSSDELRRNSLDQLENEIKIYEVQYQTGNKILDTILTSQNLYCLKHEIEMTCIANGKILDFMDVMDICTIFGNALDNAIECELKIADKDKRMIRLKVFRQKEFVLISVMNYCEEIPVMQNGLPMTSKKNQAYHGFGVKSIQVSAEKYGGTISVSVDNNWFKLLVMIPLKS